MFDNDIGYVSFDPGQIEQDAWNDGFEDGMNEIIDLIDKFKKKNYLREHKLIMFINELKTYVNENKPRRNNQ